MVNGKKRSKAERIERRLEFNCVDRGFNPKIEGVGEGVENTWRTRRGKARRGEAKVGGGGGGGNRLFAYPAIHLRLEVGSVGTEPRKVILKRCIIPVNETERASLRHAARQVRSNARESVKDPQRNACVCVCVCVCLIV